MHAIVIESPNKRALFYSALDQFYPNDFKVIATKGRIYDLCEETNNYIPVNNSVYSYLEGELANVDRIVIATDNDVEGELIGYHAHTIAPQIEYDRIIISDLDHMSLKKAFQNPVQLRTDMINEAAAKRMIDRLVGFNYSSKPNSLYPGGATVGRVLTPTLSEVKKEGGLIGDFCITLSVNGNNIAFTSESEEGLKVLADTLKHDPCSVDVSDLINEDKVNSLANFEDLISNVSSITQKEPVEVEAAVQKLYEEGAISYPRTISRDATPEQVEVLKRQLFQDTGDDTANGDHLINTNNHTHSAIIPLKGLDYRVDHNNPKTTAYGLLSRRCAIALTGKYKKKSIKLTPTPKIKTILEQFRIKTPSYIYEFTTPDERLCCTHDGNSMIFGLNTGVELGVVWPRSTQLTLLKMMSSLGIAEPSTIVTHAAKISSKYLSNSGQINIHGENALNHAAKVLPALLLHSTYRQLEHILKQRDLDANQKVLNCMSALNINTKKPSTDVREYHQENDNNTIDL
ncbi:DNA topoisomerase [Neptuniibacter sp. QD37_11]|uniref:DNA topoisomerase n=1 Tax=Neptuniibacter sp. QD37_11 TaxID=3398209 RepID=UPI0039F550BC